MAGYGHTDDGKDKPKIIFVSIIKRMSSCKLKTF